MTVHKALLTLTLAGLLSLAAAPAARADQVILTSGGRVRGKIVRESRRAVTIRTRGGTTVIPRDEIDRIERGATIFDKYKQRLKKIDGSDPEAHYSLGLWLKKEGERSLAKKEFQRVLELDEDHRFAREELGFVRQDGVWIERSALKASAAQPRARRESSQFKTPCSPQLAQALSTAKRAKQPLERKQALLLLSEREAEVERCLTLLGGEDAPKKLRIAVNKHAPAAITLAGEALRPHVAAYVAEVVWPALDRSLAAHATRLAKAHDRTVKKVAGLFREIELGASEVEETRAKALERWIKHRDEALRVIFDKQIYPDANHGRSGQPTVDEHVERVRALWPTFDGLIQKDLAKLLSLSGDEAKEALEVLEQAGVRYAELKSTIAERGLQAEAPVAPPLALRCFLLYQAERVSDALALSDRLNGWETELLRRLRDERVRRHNAGFKRKNPQDFGVKPSGPEVEQVRITNDYRILMGRPAVEIDPRLVASARGHSADMTRLGFFAHQSPVSGKESPSQRMAAAGYPAMGGENISLGSVAPKATHIAWYNSSGHHRNILGARWNAMGSGQDGNHWTQNFGGAATLQR